MVDVLFTPVVKKIRSLNVNKIKGEIEEVTVSHPIAI